MKQYDVAYTKAERKKQTQGPSAVASENEYPYGLCLRLDDGTLEKLGIDSLPKVGATFKVEATAKVTSVSSNEGTGGKNRCVELQVTKLGVGSGAQSMEDAAREGIEEADDD